MEIPALHERICSECRVFISIRTEHQLFGLLAYVQRGEVDEFLDAEFPSKTSDQSSAFHVNVVETEVCRRIFLSDEIDDDVGVLHGLEAPRNPCYSFTEGGGKTRSRGYSYSLFVFETQDRALHRVDGSRAA